MKPDQEEFRTALPEVDERFLSEHLSRLSDRYFKSFTKSDIQQHVTKLYGLSPRKPVEFLAKERRDGSTDCTVLAFDYPHEFSMITGILAGMGFNVSSGEQTSEVETKHGRRIYGSTTEEDCYR